MRIVNNIISKKRERNGFFFTLHIEAIERDPERESQFNIISNFLSSMYALILNN